MKTFLAGVIVATCITAGVNHVMATPSAKAPISACAHKKTGDLRLKTGKKCKSTERAVAWPSSQATPLTGAQGPAGIQGVSGLQGSAGVQGPQGSAGAAGAPGVDGAVGVAGTPGTNGAPGINGTNGLSRAYQKNFLGGQITTLELAPKTMNAINLPAGNYIVSANLTATSEGTFQAKCYFIGISAPSTIGLKSFENIADGSAVLQTHVSLLTDDVLGINCWRTGGGAVINVEGSIYAIAVDTITDYSPDFLCPSSLEDKSSAQSMAC
jgi:hypothetical protein